MPQSAALDAGDATPILIPGNMCDARLWPPAVRRALPGAIDADTAQDSTIAGMAARALALTTGMVLPVGLSMGGNIALEMARQAPERIAGLILLDFNAGADLPERAAARPAHQQLVREGLLEAIVVDELVPLYLAAAHRDNPELQSLLRDMALGLGADVFIRQSEALRTRADLRNTLRDCDVPVLLACGAEDRVCPPRWHRDWAQLARRPTLLIVDDAGHMLSLEQPEALARMIMEWRG